MPKQDHLRYYPQLCSVLPEVLLRERWHVLLSYLSSIDGDVSKAHLRGNIGGFLAKPRHIAFSQMLMKSLA